MWRKTRIPALCLAMTLPLYLAAPIAATTPDSRVADAAMRNDIDGVRSLLRQAADVNDTQGDGMTALHWAAFNENGELAQLLLYAGANVRATTRLGITPLHLAAQAGSAPLLDILLKAGADPKIATSAGLSPLMLAAAAGNPEAVEVLLKNGADPNATEKTHGQTALMFAAANNRDQAITALLRGGAKGELATNVVTPKETPSFGARGQAQNNMDEGPVIAADPFGGMTALLYAAREGHTEAAKALLDGGIDVNEMTGDHTSALMIACINGKFDTAMFLLERGADPQIASLANGTPLYGVINVQWAPKVFYPQPTLKLEETTHLELMAALLDHGANPNVKLKKDLWYTGFNGGGGIQSTGATPFWRAAYAADVAAMRLLVSRGADPNLATATHVTPLLAASGVSGRFGTDEVVAPQGRMAAVVYLVEELHADVNAADGAPPSTTFAETGAVPRSGGITALHNAAARGDNEMILYLVSKGARADAVARNGQTVADLANGPIQRVQPYADTIALLEMLGSKNSHKCVSC
jgi:ankyrin repeat protein